MKQSDDKGLPLERRFDLFLKRIVKNGARSYERMEKRSWHKNVIFSNELVEINSVGISFFIEKEFSVNDMTFTVRGEEIINALEILSELSRNIILLYYFAKMTDNEIAGELRINRRKVNRYRCRALNFIRGTMEVKYNANGWI